MNTFTLSFDGPVMTKEERQLAMTSAIHMCAGELRNMAIADTVQSPTALLTLARVSATSDELAALPGAVQRALGRRPGSRRPVDGFVAGFYTFDSREPCVLNYICVHPELRSLHLGEQLLAHYESAIRMLYPRQCPRVYLAAVNVTTGRDGRLVPHERLFSFYRRNGYTQHFREAEVRGSGFFDYVDGTTGVLVHFKWPEETDIFGKALYADRQVGPAPPASAPMPTDLLDDDDDDSDASPPPSQCMLLVWP